MTSHITQSCVRNVVSIDSPDRSRLGIRAVSEPSAVPVDGASHHRQALALTEVLFSDPRHFFRSYSAAELGRVMTTAGSGTPV
ncbi:MULTISPECIES: hypothetical protein [Streptomyces]|uniref:hypothetical protein n=1 Tax=Streptomyces TaxID=1883 RepID=UPI0036891914